MTNFLPDIEIKNAFTEDEISYLDQAIQDNVYERFENKNVYQGSPNFGKRFSIREHFDFVTNTAISKLILSKLPKVLQDNIKIWTSFKLTSYMPYDIHNDHEQLECSNSERPFGVIIIPFSSGDLIKTIILNQFGRYHTWVEYKEKNPKFLPKGEMVDKITFDNLFSHQLPQERYYMSIKDVYTWMRGNIMLFDLQYFHLSNDFAKHGIKSKEGITLFTKIDKDKFDVCYNELMSMKNIHLSNN